MPIEIARAPACRAHRVPRYVTLPSCAHLGDVAAILRPGGDDAVTGGCRHAIVEDADTTPDALERVSGAFTMRCVLLLTDEPGLTLYRRKARTCDQLRNDRCRGARGTPPCSSTRRATWKIAIDQSAHQAFRAAACRPGLPSLGRALWRELDDACPL